MTAPSVHMIVALHSMDNTTHNVGYSSTGAIKAQATHVTSPAPPYSPSAATPNWLKLDCNSNPFDCRAIIGHFNDDTNAGAVPCIRQVFPWRFDAAAGAPSTNTWIVRRRNSSLGYSDTTFFMGLKFNTAGNIELHTSSDMNNGTLALKATGPTVPAGDTTYMIEWAVVKRANGAAYNYQVVVRLNGVTEINYQMIGSAYASGDRSWGGAIFGDANAAASNSCIMYVGPYYAAQEDASVDMLKPTIRRVRPNGNMAAGYTQWFNDPPTYSVAAAYTDWDDPVPDDGTTRAATKDTTGGGKKQASDCETVADGTYTPYGVTVNGWVLYTGSTKSAPGEFVMVTNGTTDVERSPSIATRGSYETLGESQQLVYMNKPGGSGWDTTAIAAMEIGYRGVCDAVFITTISVTMIYAEVLINANEANYPQLPLPLPLKSLFVRQAVNRAGTY